MKIAEPENIKAGEQELINSIMEQLNSEIIGSIASGRLAVNKLEFRNGDMVIHENRIVYKMEFETSIAISVLFDREGNLINEDEKSIDIPQVEEDVLPDEVHATIAPEADVGEFEDDADDQMNLVLENTREFWLQKSQDAIEPADTEAVKSDDEMFQEVMQKNKDFWQEQAASI